MNAPSPADAPPAVSWQAKPFEAGFLGGPVFALALEPAADAAAVRDACAALRAEAPRLVFARLADGDDTGAAALEANDFRLIEDLVTFERPLDGDWSEAPGDVGPAREDEHEALIAIAASAFTQDRFHADPDIDNDAADRLKATWVANGLRGRAEIPLAARQPDGRPAGFNLVLRRGDAAIIDLIAVAEDARGLGLGAALVAGALAAAQADGATVMRVGTQAANAPSQALYRRFGFRPVSRQRTYHWTP